MASQFGIIPFLFFFFSFFFFFFFLGIQLKMKQQKHLDIAKKCRLVGFNNGSPSYSSFYYKTFFSSLLFLLLVPSIRQEQHSLFFVSFFTCQNTRFEHFK